MGARGAGLAPGARGLVLIAALAALCCGAPALLHPGSTDWAAVCLLAGLYAAAEAAPRLPLLARRTPRLARAWGGEDGPPPEVCGPLLLTAVLLLRPEGAALVPVAGALAGRVPARHAAARRVWRAARLSLAAYAAATAARLPAGVLPGAAPDAGQPLAAAGVPAALLPAAVAVLVHCLLLATLDGAVLVVAERRPPRTAWHGSLSPLLPPHAVHALAGLLMALLWRSPYGPVGALFVLLPMALCCWVFDAYRRERAAHRATVRALVQAVDIKDRYTRGHSERVGRASALIAGELGMDDRRTETLRFAGILHDVGKLGVPTRLLRKPGPLSPLERSVLELHPEYGHEMVRGIGFLGEARTAILHHHERLDGTGYPYGLAGDEIPEPARLVAVADAFDAMTSHRSYRRGRPVGDAVAELHRCAGTHFDPRMVDALTRALDRHGWSAEVTADPAGDGARAEPEPPPHRRSPGHRGVPAPRPAVRRPGRHRAGHAAPAMSAATEATTATPGAGAAHRPLPRPFPTGPTTFAAGPCRLAAAAATGTDHEPGATAAQPGTVAGVPRHETAPPGALPAGDARPPAQPWLRPEDGTARPRTEGRHDPTEPADGAAADIPGDPPSVQAWPTRPAHDHGAAGAATTGPAVPVPPAGFRDGREGAGPLVHDLSGEERPEPQSGAGTYRAGARHADDGGRTDESHGPRAVGRHAGPRDRGVQERSAGGGRHAGPPEGGPPGAGPGGTA